MNPDCARPKALSFHRAELIADIYTNRSVASQSLFQPLPSVLNRPANPTPPPCFTTLPPISIVSRRKPFDPPTDTSSIPTSFPPATTTRCGTGMGSSSDCIGPTRTRRTRSICATGLSASLAPRMPMATLPDASRRKGPRPLFGKFAMKPFPRAGRTDRRPGPQRLRMDPAGLARDAERSRVPSSARSMTKSGSCGSGTTPCSPAPTTMRRLPTMSQAIAAPSSPSTPRFMRCANTARWQYWPISLATQFSKAYRAEASSRATPFCASSGRRAMACSGIAGATPARLIRVIAWSNFLPLRRWHSSARRGQPHDRALSAQPHADAVRSRIPQPVALRSLRTTTTPSSIPTPTGAAPSGSMPTSSTGSRCADMDSATKLTGWP